MPHPGAALTAIRPGRLLDPLLKPGGGASGGPLAPSPGLLTMSPRGALRLAVGPNPSRRLEDDMPLCRVHLEDGRPDLHAWTSASEAPPRALLRNERSGRAGSSTPGTWTAAMSASMMSSARSALLRATA